MSFRFLQRLLRLYPQLIRQCWVVFVRLACLEVLPDYDDRVATPDCLAVMPLE